MTDTTTTTEPCYTCGGDFNCPDCGVWLTREDYNEYVSRGWFFDIDKPALTRILSEEAAPAEAAPVDAHIYITEDDYHDLRRAARDYDLHIDEPIVVVDAPAEAHLPRNLPRTTHWTPINMPDENILPAPTDPRDAKLEALHAEVAALREMRERIITHATGVLRYENVGPTEFFRGTCGAYKTVLGIINTTKDTRTNSTPVES